MNKDNVKATTDLLLDKIMDAANNDLTEDYSFESILKVGLQYAKIVPELIKISDDIENGAVNRNEKMEILDKIQNNPKAIKLLEKLSCMIE